MSLAGLLDVNSKPWSNVYCQSVNCDTITCNTINTLNATSLNVPNTLVKRDSTGSFSTQGITSTQLTINSSAYNSVFLDGGAISIKRSAGYGSLQLAPSTNGGESSFTFWENPTSFNGAGGNGTLFGRNLGGAYSFSIIDVIPGTSVRYLLTYDKSTLDCSLITNTSVAGSFSPLTGIVGKTDGSNALAGRVGEYVKSVLNATVVGTETYLPFNSINLTAGDWDIVSQGTFYQVSGGAGNYAVYMLINSATSGGVLTNAFGDNILQTYTTNNGVQNSMTVCCRANLTSATTMRVYIWSNLGATHNFESKIQARRVR